MVVVDWLSKRIHAIPTITALNSAGVAHLFLENVWKYHGLPKVIISDCGPTFVSYFSKELAKILGIKLSPSTAYHPQTNGQTEHTNQEIEIRIFISHWQDDWTV